MTAPTLWFNDLDELIANDDHEPIDCDDCPCDGSGSGSGGSGSGDPVLEECGGCSGGLESVPTRWIVDTTGTTWSEDLACCEDLYSGVFELEFFAGSNLVCNYRLVRPPVTVSDPDACDTFSPIEGMIVSLSLSAAGGITLGITFGLSGSAGAEWNAFYPTGGGGLDCSQSYELTFAAAIYPCAAGPGAGSENPITVVATITPVF